MARPVAEGEYLIVNVRNMGMALDVSGANRNNGANVQIWNILNNRAQLFTVRYNSDDTVRILAAFTGKSVDVNGGSITAGTNVQQYTNNDTRAQKWVLAATGNSVTFRNKTYQTYKIQIAADTSLLLDAAGTAATAGSNCLLATDSGATDQHWIFVPRPKLRSGGVYELHSMLNNELVLDITSWSKTNGASAIIWPTHGGNNQKFVLIEEETDKWRIRNVHSGKYLDIKGNEAVNSASIVQWGEPVNVRHQQWKILERDTNDHVYKGVECAVVSIGAYGVTSDGNTYMMHVYNSISKNGTDVNIYEDAGTAGYRWLLYPVNATDPNMPIPSEVMLTESLDGNYMRTRVPCGEWYASWLCTKSWTNSGPNHYEWRTRKRYMSSQSSKWLEWSEYTPWETANCRQVGSRAWLADPIDGTYDISQYKNLQVEFQVRCVGVEETENLVGQAATADFYFLWRPTFEFELVGVSPEGLRIAYSNDYPCGMCNLTLEAIVAKRYSGEEIPISMIAPMSILKESISFESLDSSGTIVVPYDKLTDPIEDGRVLQLYYHGGTDQISKIFETDVEVIAHEDADYDGAYAKPFFFSNPDRVLIGSIEDSDCVSRMWLRVGRKTIELKSKDGAYKLYEIPYPFGVDFDVFTLVYSPDGSKWGTDSTHFDATDSRLGLPCHAWSWGDGGHFLLECDTEPLVTDRTLKPVYEADTLDSRARESVSFAPTIGGNLRAKGVLVDGETEFAEDDMLDLLGARHVLYRSPHGVMADVAIVGVTYKKYDGYLEAEIEMIEETV